MENLKKYLVAALRLFAPIGIGIAAVVGFAGGIQALFGFSPVGEKWLIAALVGFLVCGAILLIRHEVLLREYERNLGNDAAKSLWRDGIPVVQSEYMSRVRQGDYRVVNRFWSAGLVNLSDGYDKYDLHVASEAGHAAIVRGILERGGDPRRPDRSGITPLMCAASKGHVSVVEMLFEHDCAIDARSSQGGVTALHSAAANGRDAMVEVLLKRGARIDAVDDDNITPLMASMVQHHWQVAQRLIDAGANLNKTDAAGANVMDYAVGFYASDAFLEKLREAGAVRALPDSNVVGTSFSGFGKVGVQWQRGCEVE